MSEFPGNPPESDANHAAQGTFGYSPAWVKVGILLSLSVPIMFVTFLFSGESMARTVLIAVYAAGAVAGTVANEVVNERRRVCRFEVKNGTVRWHSGWRAGEAALAQLRVVHRGENGLCFPLPRVFLEDAEGRERRFVTTRRSEGLIPIVERARRSGVPEMNPVALESTYGFRRGGEDG